MAGQFADIMQKALANDAAALKHLISHLASFDEEVQDAAFTAVQSNKEPELWANLLALMADARWGTITFGIVSQGSEEHRMLALLIYGLFVHDRTSAIGQVKGKILAAGRQSKSSAVRRVSAELEEVRRTSRAPHSLIASMHDSDNRIRGYAAYAIGRIGDPDLIEPLITFLSSSDDSMKYYARRALVAIGRPALPSLLKALTDSREQVRWEAAKGLGQMKDPRAATALVDALDDNNAGVRWLAAEGLIRLGREGLVPLLEAFLHKELSGLLRRGGHHILHELADGDLGPVVEPVLETLEEAGSAWTVPPAALEALTGLRGSGLKAKA